MGEEVKATVAIVLYLRYWFGSCYPVFEVPKMSCGGKLPLLLTWKDEREPCDLARYQASFVSGS